MSTKVEAEHNKDLHLHLYWDTTGRFQGAQELQGFLAVLVGQGDHFCLEFQEGPAKTQTEQVQTLSLASNCKDSWDKDCKDWGTKLSICNKVCVTVVGNLC